MKKIIITNEKTSSLKANEIFVFGSNLAGQHGGGAALVAHQKFGAVIGIGEGLTGQCYALPTKDKNIETLPLIDIHKSVEVLYQKAIEDTSKFYIITAVGCGLAGYNANDIAPMFEPFVHLENCSLPQSFVDIIFPKVIKGYKVTDKFMKCRNMQFSLNKTFKAVGEISICNNGFHFCKQLADCFSYYSFSSENRVFEVEGSGDYEFNSDKMCVEKIKFVKELTWFEVLKLVNTGKDNTGYRNSGNRNSGNYNSGNRNSGNYNSGDRNSGHRNSGNYNSGYRNSGNYNSGYRNSGNYNSGDYNSGDYNSGYRNSGHRNSGDYNSGYRNSGYFNSTNSTIKIFNTQTDVEFGDMDVPYIELPITTWVSESDMTDQEKKDNPQFFVSQGYLKKQSYKEAWATAWSKADSELKNRFLNLPHFDAKVFEEITGIKVDK